MENVELQKIEIWRNPDMKNLQIEYNNTIYEEEWKPIIGYEEFYEISSFGRIKILDYKRRHSRNPNCFHIIKSKIKLLHLNKLLGYIYVTLKNSSDKTNSYSVHRLVAKHFVENPLNKREVNHINTIKTDNFYLNLEWNTPLENTHNVFKNGHPAKRVKLKIEDVPKIKELYKTGNLSYREIGEIYGVKSKAIMRLIQGKTWNF